jgi:hypothetical protein
MPFSLILYSGLLKRFLSAAFYRCQLRFFFQRSRRPRFDSLLSGPQLQADGAIPRFALFLLPACQVFSEADRMFQGDRNRHASLLHSFFISLVILPEIV